MTKPQEQPSERTLFENNSDMLLNVFQIKNKRYHVLLDNEKIIYEREETKCAAIQSACSYNEIVSNYDNADNLTKGIIYLMDVIAVKKTKEIFPIPINHYNYNDHAKHSSKKSPLTITIHFAKRIIKSSRDCNRWKHSVLHLYNNDNNIIMQWYNSIEKSLKRRPKLNNILVFVNPYGGQKKGVKVYEKYCKPLLEMTDIQTNCIISQRSNEIFEILMTEDLEQYDAVCCVGGDGTAAEVINGLLFRSMKDLNINANQPEYIPKPKLPIAVIPGGSTDTIAYSLHGTSDVLTAVIHLVLGFKRGLDICSVRNRSGLIRFCASILSYGYLGDISLESEKYRWMGTQRYEYVGVKKFFNNCGYNAEIHLLQDNAIASSHSNTSTEEIFDDCNGSMTMQQQDRETQCFANCHRCKSVQEDLSNKSATQLTISTDTDIAVNSTATNSKVENYQQPSQQHNYQSKELYSEDSKQINKQIQDENIRRHEMYKIVKGDFFMISGANINCACTRGPNGISKYCHLGDGYIDLVLVRKTSLLNNLRLILNMASKNGNIQNLPFVEVHRTKKFYFHSLSKDESDDLDSNIINHSRQPINEISSSRTNKNSQWNCDGEIVHEVDIVMSSHCQLIKVFMRGPLPFDADLAADTEELCCM